MKKLFTMIMAIVVIASLICKADATAYTSNNTDLVKIYTDKLVNELIVEAEKDKEDGDIDYYEIEVIETEDSTMTLHLYASTVNEDDSRFYDCIEAFYTLNAEKLVEARGDIDDYEFEDGDCIYYAEITCIDGIARH